MTTQTDEIYSLIRTADDAFESIFSQGDAKGMANLYTDNGQLLPTGSEIITGKSGIQAFWQGAMDMGIKKAKLDILEVEQYEDTAVEIGQYTLSGEGGQVLDQGKYVVIWKEEDGDWKLHRDIWNTSLAQS